MRGLSLPNETEFSMEELYKKAVSKFMQNLPHVRYVSLSAEYEYSADDSTDGLELKQELQQIKQWMHIITGEFFKHRIQVLEFELFASFGFDDTVSFSLQNVYKKSLTFLILNNKRYFSVSEDTRANILIFAYLFSLTLFVVSIIFLFTLLDEHLRSAAHRERGRRIRWSECGDLQSGATNDTVERLVTIWTRTWPNSCGGKCSRATTYSSRCWKRSRTSGRSKTQL